MDISQEESKKDETTLVKDSLQNHGKASVF